jgi:hypothetical protein
MSYTHFTTSTSPLLTHAKFDPRKGHENPVPGVCQDTSNILFAVLWVGERFFGFRRARCEDLLEADALFLLYASETKLSIIVCLQVEWYQNILDKPERRKSLAEARCLASSNVDYF